MPAVTFNQLKERLAENPFLLIECTSGDASLVPKDSMLAKLGSETYFIMDALSAFTKFKQLVGEQRQFSLTDISKIADVEYHGAHFWMREKILSPSIQKARGAGRGRGPVFSFADAFAAGIIGTLRRQGLNLDILSSIAPLLNNVKKKRTARKESASRQS